MLLSEFENLTDIKPDSILYSVIEKEYNAVDGSGRDVWDSKAQFCHAFKFDEDGLAGKCQRLANEAIWKKDEEYRNAQTKSSERIVALHAECERLKAELAALEAENRRLKEDYETSCKTLREMRCDKIKADMFCVLEQYVCDDVDPVDIGRAVVAYVDLLDWSALYNEA